MSLPQFFPRVKASVGTIHSPMHQRDFFLAQVDNGFVVLDADADRLAGNFTVVTNELMTRIGEELRVSKVLSANDKAFLQKAKTWNPLYAKLTDERLEQLLYSALLILARQRKVLIQTKDRRVLFRRLNQAASVEVNGVANIFDRGGLTLARLPVASFDRLVSAALLKGCVSSDLIREVLPMESRARKDFAFALAEWLRIYLDLEIRG